MEVMLRFGYSHSDFEMPVSHPKKRCLLVGGRMKGTG